MKIKCPECETKFSLGKLKAGRFKPTCKQCQKAFVIQISSDDPPKVAVGKIRPKNQTADQRPDRDKADEPLRKQTSQHRTPDTKPQKPTPQSAKTIADVDETLEQPTGVSMDETLDPGVQSSGFENQAAQTKATDVDATTDYSVTSNSATEATVDPGADGTMQTLDPSVAISVGNSIGQQNVSAVVRSGSSANSSPSVRVGAASNSDSGSKSGSKSMTPPPDRLGGYRILRELGRGAMGAVYEAKQISLDRLVALKTIRGRLANNPASLARFTREAYAAAQLAHHNVVQIYDFGEDDGKHFFSMEWVRGGPLSDVIRTRGPLEPKLAVGYTLQAARGLQFAHRNGMVHRDVKPANLLLSDEGVVKVADLGLVKIPDLGEPDEGDFEPGTVSASGMSGTEVTMQGTAVGTPAYMAPEQGIDAANVDHRADIYSLGCTLFYLLAGRAPFDSSVVSEVMEQHAKQQVPDLSEINKRIPSELKAIVERSMAKRPEDRFASLSEMIADMESFLGIESEGKFSPTTQQADAWEPIATRFASSAPLMKLSGPILFAYTALCAVITLAMPMIGFGWLLMGPSMFIAGLAAAIGLGAAGGKSAVASSIRRWISSLSLFDIVVSGIVGTLLLLVIVLTGLWLGVLVGAIAGSLAGALFHFGLVAPSRKSQSEPLAQAERFIRNLRIDGADEEGIRDFVARYSGKSWHIIFESLFGYESLLIQRKELQGDPTIPVSSLRTGVRDKVCQSFKSKADANQQSTDQKRLAKIEEKGLTSEGISPDEARERAWQMAMAVIENAKVDQADSASDAKLAAEVKRQKMKDMLADARSGKYKKKRDPLAPLKFALGGHTRLLAGCLLLGVFAIWVQTSGLADTLKEIATQENLNLQDVNTGLANADNTAEQTILGTGGLSLGVAGLLLAMSSFVSGWRMTPFAIIATIVILFGPNVGVPGFGVIQSWMVAAAIGLVIYVPGIMWGESPIKE